MATIYRIAKWKDTFEKSDAKKLVSLPWISVPTNLDSNGFMTMAEDFEDDAPSIYGAWIALCAFAAGCNERGTLMTARGKPIPLSRVARRTGWPLSIFERLVNWATSETIGWIEVMESPAAPPVISPASPDDLPAISVRSPDYGQDGQDKTRQNGRTDGTVGAPEESARPVPARPILFADVWEETRDRAKALRDAIEPKDRKLLQADRLLCLQFAAIQTGYPEISKKLAVVVTKINDRVRRKNPPASPWGWVKSELIRICNSDGPGYDAAIDSLDPRLTESTG